MISYKRCAATIALVSGLLTGASASALPLTAVAKGLAAGSERLAPTIQVQVRRGVRAAPRIRAPRVIGRPVFRTPRYYRPFVRRRAPIIIGVSPFFYDPYPYDYDPYYYYGAPDDGAIAYCIRRFRSYDIRTRTYLGFDGLRHPCP